VGRHKSECFIKWNRRRIGIKPEFGKAACARLFEYLSPKRSTDAASLKVGIDEKCIYLCA